MSDIVERMKNYIPGEPAHEEAVPEVLELAIAEIERLRTALRLARNDMRVSISEIERELAQSSGDRNNG
jgi:hypothetical protein